MEYTIPIREILTVSKLNRQVRRLVEDGMAMVWVEGEISNFKLHGSGHRYFTLKDSESQVSCVMWRTRPAPPTPLESGALVRVYGKVTVWEQGGRYQIDVQSVIPAGVGGLQAAFEALKRKLAAEGLFDTARKRSLPRFPRAVGIATSPTGAAIRDLVWGFRTRFPPAEVFLYPVAVQGVGAAGEIAAAIEAFNRFGGVDVIVIGRGGGSLEDLWAFNEEVVVRAIVSSRVPVVSAVGHEIDVTLSDLAADLRAPTPTAAAALVVPDREDLAITLAERRASLIGSLARRIRLWKERVGAIEAGYGFRRIPARINDERHRLVELERRFEAGLLRIVANAKSKLSAARQHLNALSPNEVLKRGYSIVRTKDRAIVRSGAELKKDDELELQFFSGGAAATVIKSWDHDR